ncbi:metallophosphoesterase [Actinoplanes rectilineatus]|uniref:metallophosphoesterase n=1 Tax=Actinoplanes rectilineatus TaxID=113571 RepID=UPI0007C6D155
MGFIAMILLVIGLIHFYLWKRLVRDPLAAGWPRRIGTAVVVLLAILVPLTLIGVRAGHFMWLAWPGYLWIAVMFYLLVTLVALEIPRLLASRLWVRRADRTTAGTTDRVDAPTPAAPADRTGESSEAELTPTASPVLAAERDSEDGRDSNDDRDSNDGKNSEDGKSDPTNKNTIENSKADKADKSETGDAEGVNRRLLLARGAAIFAGLTAASVTGYGVKTATGGPQIDRFQMPMAKLPRTMDGTRLAVVSDIHIGPLTGVDHARRITQVINSVNADLVCVVGDLVDGSVAELGEFAAPLADIQSRHGTFFVTGNHEYYSGYEEWVDEVARLGMRPLRNERLEIAGLDLAGVNDLSGAEQGDAPDFARALGDRDTNRPVVLMAHQPVAAVDAAPYGVDLQISGHTHGGQMAPFNYLVSLEQPVVSGFGRVDGVPVYVTNGAGFWGPPVRVGAPPQVTVIELRVA